ncbi:MAG: GatB/YqeY domain-containing protein [Rhizomicrobium sp.]
MLREKFQDALKEAMKARSQRRVSTLRMVLSALKEREIARRGGEGPSEPDDAEIVSLLGKLVRQREESAMLYERGGRPELAAAEREEIAIIGEFLPRQMSEQEMRAAVEAAVAETGATSIKDMGRVMAALKARHAGQMDFSKAGAVVKDLLAPR